jgi:isoleucyl-tRNA synthetase
VFQTIINGIIVPRSLNFEPPKANIEIKANTKILGKKYGSKTPGLVKLIEEKSAELAQLVEDPSMKGKSVLAKLEGQDIAITEEFFTVRRSPPQDYVESSGVYVQAFLDTKRTPELDNEGYVREVRERRWRAKFLVRKVIGTF